MAITKTCESLDAQKEGRGIGDEGRQLSSIVQHKGWSLAVHATGKNPITPSFTLVYPFCPIFQGLASNISSEHKNCGTITIVQLDVGQVN